jgi:hypothetical protein
LSLRDKLKGAFENHEDFHGSEEFSVLVLSYERDGSWHATDTGPDSIEVDPCKIIRVLSELICELSEKAEDPVH